MEIYEDIYNGKSHKVEIYRSVRAFLADCRFETATQVWASFFTSYWIGTQSAKNPFTELIQKVNLFEKHAGVLLTKQRDHYVHSVLVFVLGLVVFTANKRFRNIFSELVLHNTSYPDVYSTRNEEFFYRWGIASLFHDVAYPLEITIKQAKRYLEFISNYPEISGEQIGLVVNLDNFDRFTSLPCIAPMPSFSKEFVEKYPDYRSFALEDSRDILANRISACFGIDSGQIKETLIRLSTGANTIDHGYYGALIVLRWYYYLIQKTAWNPAYFYFPIADSASAILLHNYYKFCLMKSPFDLGRLRADSHPISFLLILCDELQEWGRIGYGEEEIGHNTPAAGFEITVTDNLLEIVYEIAQAKDGNTKDKQKSVKDLLCLEAVFPDGIAVKAK